MLRESWDIHIKEKGRIEKEGKGEGRGQLEWGGEGEPTVNTH